MGKGGNVTSAGWQVTLCDPMWHASSRRSEACCELLYSVYLTVTFTTRTSIFPQYIRKLQIIIRQDIRRHDTDYLVRVALIQSSRDFNASDMQSLQI